MLPIIMLIMLITIIFFLWEVYVLVALKWVVGLSEPQSPPFATITTSGRSCVWNSAKGVFNTGDTSVMDILSAFTKAPKHRYQHVFYIDITYM